MQQISHPAGQGKPGDIPRGAAVAVAADLLMSPAEGLLP
jgi:hypothetical protein